MLYSGNCKLNFVFCQIYVEVERARLTHRLAQLREEEGDVATAADIIQELQVETYGSMEKREKVWLSVKLSKVKFRCPFEIVGSKKLFVRNAIFQGVGINSINVST